MCLSAHCCPHRSAEGDLEASRRQADPARAARRVRAGRSSRIGRPAVDSRDRYGGRGRLQSIHLFYPLPLLPANPTERLRDSNDTVLSLIAQEVGHRWGASIRFRDRAARL